MKPRIVKVLVSLAIITVALVWIAKPVPLKPQIDRAGILLGKPRSLGQRPFSNGNVLTYQVDAKNRANLRLFLQRSGYIMKKPDGSPWNHFVKKKFNLPFAPEQNVWVEVELTEFQHGDGEVAFEPNIERSPGIGLL